MGPPQPWPFDGDRPRHLVLAGGEGLVEPVLGVAHDRPKGDGGGLGGIEHRSERDDGSDVGGLAAQGEEAGDAHGPGLVHRHRAPDPTGVPVGVQAVPVLKHPGEVALGRPVALSGACHLDGEQMLVAPGQGVGEEVALGVAYVGPVQPDVTEVEEPVQREPRPTSRGRGRSLEAAPVQEGAVGGGEGGRGPPMAGHGDLVPPAVVEVGPGEPPAEGLVGDGGTPRPRQIHA